MQTRQTSFAFRDFLSAAGRGIHALEPFSVCPNKEVSFCPEEAG